MKTKRLPTVRESAAVIAAQAARLVAFAELLLQGRSIAAPATSTRLPSQTPAAVRQRRHRERLRQIASDARHARHAGSHAHPQSGNGAGSVTPRHADVTPRPSSSSLHRSASAASSPEEKKPKQKSKEKQPSAAKRKGGGELQTLMKIWGSSAIKHRVSSIFGGDPKQLFAVKAACGGEVEKYTECVELYHRECALARRTPSVDGLAAKLKKIRNGATGAHLHIDSAVLQREAAGRKML